MARQFRFPTYVNGNADGMLIETCAGQPNTDDAATCIKRETEEETGYRIGEVHKVSEGGGEHHEGEDIEVIEMTLDSALAKVAAGDICDGKTILLLQHAKLAGLLA